MGCQVLVWAVGWSRPARISRSRVNPCRSTGRARLSASSVGEFGVRKEQLGRDRPEQHRSARRARHVDRQLGRQHERGVLLPPRLRGFREVIEHRRVLQVAPGLVDDHQLQPRGLGWVLDLEPYPLEQIRQRRVGEVRMLDRPGRVDHLPVGELEVRGSVGRVVEVGVRKLVTSCHILSYYSSIRSDPPIPSLFTTGNP